MTEVQTSVPDPVAKFKEVYFETLAECIKRRKASQMTKESLADWLAVDRRQIFDLEKGKIKVGLLLRYADKFDVEITLKAIKH